MMYFKNLQTNKVCALVAATLILPTLAYAEHDSAKGNEHRSGDHHGDRDKDKVPVVPETNAAWVLVPFFGVVLLFSSRQLLRPKADQNQSC